MADATTAVPATPATDSQGGTPDKPKGPTPDFDRLAPKRSYIKRRKRKDIVMRTLIVAAFIVALIPLISVLWTVIANGVQRLDGYFLTHNMKGIVGGNPANGTTDEYGGIYHAMMGTLEITLGALVISVPIGIFTSIYLVEYASNGKKSKLYHAISFFVDIMSGVPSIVAGLFAFSLFTVILGKGTYNGFVGAVALSVLMIPTVVRSSEEMLKIVPNDLREASYALGVTKSRTITKVVLRTALSGIVSGVLLAIARVIGETAPLLIAAGTISSTNFNLFSGRMMSLPVYIYNEYQQGAATCTVNAVNCLPGIRMERAWAASLVLIILVLVLNLIGRLVAKIFAVDDGQK